MKERYSEGAGWHNGLKIKLSRQEQQQIEELLSRGMQSVRTVIRALVLGQMDAGQSTVEAGAGIGISAKAAWEIAASVIWKEGWSGRFTMRPALSQSRCWMLSTASALSPWSLARHPLAGRGGR